MIHSLYSYYYFLILLITKLWNKNYKLKKKWIKTKIIKETPIKGLYFSQINPIISKVKGNEIKTPNKKAAIILAPLSPGIFYNLILLIEIYE